MKIPLFVIGLLACACSVSAQSINRVTTLFCSSVRTNQGGQITYGPATNSITIPAGEAARVSTVKTWFGPNAIPQSYALTGFLQRGVWWDVLPGDVVEGPVTFEIEVACNDECYSRLTLERWKVLKK